MAFEFLEDSPGIDSLLKLCKQSVIGHLKIEKERSLFGSRDV